MIIFYPASKDATLYSINPTQNTGRDEILEISKTYELGVLSISRPIIQFDVNEISGSLASGDIIITSADLILKQSESDEIPTDYVIEMYPLNTDWEMGIGTKYDEISTKFATWDNSKTSTPWILSGGDYDATPVSTQTFDYESVDIELEMTTLLNQWIDGTIVTGNNGVILKLQESQEVDSNDYGVLQYFSRETNTIYQPKLRIGWDDSVFTTGSLLPIDSSDIYYDTNPVTVSDDIMVVYRRLKPTYKVGSKPKIRLEAKDRYPLKTYTNQYPTQYTYYLPLETYYQIKDAVTNEIIVPYSDFTKVSCDENGNYFYLNLLNWETNREYYIELKVHIHNNIEYFLGDDITFEVEK